jgi:hypothetical protein
VVQMIASCRLILKTCAHQPDDLTSPGCKPSVCILAWLSCSVQAKYHIFIITETASSASLGMQSLQDSRKQHRVLISVESKVAQLCALTAASLQVGAVLLSSCGQCCNVLFVERTADPRLSNYWLTLHV